MSFFCFKLWKCSIWRKFLLIIYWLKIYILDLNLLREIIIKKIILIIIRLFRLQRKPKTMSASSSFSVTSSDSGNLNQIKPVSLGNSSAIKVVSGVFACVCWCQRMTFDLRAALSHPTVSFSPLTPVLSSLASPQLKANLHVLTCTKHQVFMTAAVGGENVCVDFFQFSSLFKL